MNNKNAQSLSTLTFILLSVHSLYGQLKVYDTGKLILGDINPPLTEVQIIGNTFFTKNYEIYSPDLSGPMIRGNNRYSTSLTPDFTWYNNDQTGFFHPSSNVIGITLGGQMNALFTPGYSVFFNPLFVSDSVYKKEIKPIRDPVSLLKKIQGSTYYYKGFSSSLNYGFVAQSIEKNIPDLVKTVQGDIKAVDYNGIIAILTESVKEQQKIIEKQQKEIENLKKRVSKLEKK